MPDAWRNCGGPEAEGASPQWEEQQQKKKERHLLYLRHVPVA